MGREVGTLNRGRDDLPADVLDAARGAVTIRLAGGVEVASPAVIRIAGLPAAALGDLCFAGSFSLACSTVRLLQRLKADAEVLSDDLFVAIGSCPSGTDKGALVGLRRAVFRLRSPNSREWNERVAGLVPADVADRLRDWTSMLEHYRRLCAELPEVLAGESAAKQDVLREVVGRPWFQRALSLASPALFGEAAKWLADETRIPQRRSLVRLAKYVARAAMKTSPYSTFTVSGWAGWTAGGPSVRLGECTAPAAVLELSGFLHARLRDTLGADRQLVAELPLRLNPSATRVGETVRFLGPPPRESIVSVPATPMVLECLRILDDGASRHRADLQAALGAGIDRLLEIGLLERPLTVADLSTDPFGELGSWLESRGARALAAAVGLVGSKLRQPPPVRLVADQVEHRQALDAAVQELGVQAGLPVRQLADRQVDLWHETAVFTEPVGELSAPAWRTALADLDVVRRVLAVLDPALPLRVALGEYFSTRFGPGSRVPFLTVHEAIARDSARPAADEIVDWLSPYGRSAWPSLSDSRLPRLRELARIRQELEDTVLPSAGPDGVIRADPGALAELAATWPRWIAAPDSIACYLQLIPDGNSPRLVVNAAHGGEGRGRSRALHLIRAAGGKAPFEGAKFEDGPAAAEFGALFGFAPNVRLASAPYEIDYPFAASGRPAGQRLPMRNLTVGHDPSTGLASLFSHGIASPVKAVHLGMMADLLLPPAARLLTRAFGCGYLLHAGVPMFDTAPAVRTTVVRSARVEIGRVVVQRARWVVPTAQVPVRTKGEPDAGYLLRIVEWLLAHDIPSRCFVRMNEALTGEGGERRFDKSRKPVYIDFSNWYLVQTFERMLASAGPVVVFEEALPAPEDAPSPERGPASVTEFIVEISAAGRRR